MGRPRLALPPLGTQGHPLIFAHRGASSLAPENSLSAFRLARDLGAKALELDVHTCSSGELVVFHDFDLERMTGRSARLCDCGLEELKRLNFGFSHGEAWKSEGIPTLKELFEALGDLVYYDIEIKSERKESDGTEARLIDLVKAYGLMGRVAVSSFNPYPLILVKRLAPEIPTAIIWSKSELLPPALRYGLGAYLSACDYLKPDYKVMGGLNILRLGAGKSREIVAWTVDDPATVQDLAAAGCHGIITNRVQDILPLFPQD